MSQKSKSLVRLQLRLPLELAEYLRQQAALSLRSLNNEMVSRLEQTRKGEPKKVKGWSAPTDSPSMKNHPVKNRNSHDER